MLELEAENWRAQLAAEIMASPIYKTMIDRVRAFQQRRGGRRATYFNHVRRLNGDAAGKTAEGSG